MLQIYAQNMGLSSIETCAYFCAPSKKNSRKHMQDNPQDQDAKNLTLSIEK